MLRLNRSPFPLYQGQTTGQQGGLNPFITPGPFSPWLPSVTHPPWISASLRHASSPLNTACLSSSGGAVGPMRWQWWQGGRNKQRTKQHPNALTHIKHSTLSVQLRSESAHWSSTPTPEGLRDAASPNRASSPEFFDVHDSLGAQDVSFVHVAMRGHDLPENEGRSSKGSSRHGQQPLL